MKKNAKYTALEVLQAIGEVFEIGDKKLIPDAVFGKVRVRIGGIAGISKPKHLIKIPESAKDLIVIVGNKKYNVKLD